MQEFIHMQNLARFVDLLEGEDDPQRRERLQSLLIEEEDKFGTRRERLEQTDLLVIQGTARLRRQQAIVDGLAGDGADTSQAERLLANMNRTLQLFSHYRERLRNSRI